MATPTSRRSTFQPGRAPLGTQGHAGSDVFFFCCDKIVVGVYSSFDSFSWLRGGAVALKSLFYFLDIHEFSSIGVSGTDGQAVCPALAETKYIRP